MVIETNCAGFGGFECGEDWWWGVWASVGIVIIIVVIVVVIGGVGGSVIGRIETIIPRWL